MIKHLFKYSIYEGLAKPKKELVRGSLKAAGNYSDDDAKLEEKPTAHSSLRDWSRGACAIQVQALYLHLSVLTPSS
jgi:hypothetical protein